MQGYLKLNDCEYDFFDDLRHNEKEMLSKKEKEWITMKDPLSENRYELCFHILCTKSNYEEILNILTKLQSISKLKPFFKINPIENIEVYRYNGQVGNIYKYKVNPEDMSDTESYFLVFYMERSSVPVIDYNFFETNKERQIFENTNQPVFYFSIGRKIIQINRYEGYLENKDYAYDCDGPIYTLNTIEMIFDYFFHKHNNICIYVKIEIEGYDGLGEYFSHSQNILKVENAHSKDYYI